MQQAMLFVIPQVYIFVHALVNFVSHNVHSLFSCTSLCNIIIIIQDISVLKLQGSQANARALHRAGFLTEEEEQAIQQGLTIVMQLIIFSTVVNQDCWHQLQKVHEHVLQVNLSMYIQNRWWQVGGERFKWRKGQELITDASSPVRKSVVCECGEGGGTSDCVCLIKYDLVV